MFDYFEGHDDEEVIKSLELPWEEVMKHYHDPILASGLINTAYMMPKWQDSSGAKWEYEYFTANDIKVKDFPEEWL